MTMFPARRPLRTEAVPTAATSAPDLAVMPPAMIDAAFACEGADPGLFFPTSEGDLHRALRLCRTCPVMAQCHDFGTATKSVGVWGGELLRDGQTDKELFPVERGPRAKRA